MTIVEQYRQVFITSLGVSDAGLDDLRYHGVEAWDSVGHMALMAAIEDAFGVTLDTDDIIDFSSFEVGKSILRKYGVPL